MSRNTGFFVPNILSLSSSGNGTSQRMEEASIAGTIDWNPGHWDPFCCGYHALFGRRRSVDPWWGLCDTTIQGCTQIIVYGNVMWNPVTESANTLGHGGIQAHSAVDSSGFVSSIFVSRGIAQPWRNRVKQENPNEQQASKSTRTRSALSSPRTVVILVIIFLILSWKSHVRKTG